jgi:hypothetical protein
MYAQNLDIDNPLLQYEIKAEEPTEGPDDTIMAFYEVIDCVNGFIKKNKDQPGIEKYVGYLHASNEMLDMLTQTGRLSIDTEFR